MQPTRVCSTLVNPVTTDTCSSSGSSVHSRCWRTAKPLHLGGRNQRALLTLFLLHANEAVSTERLVDQLWGEHPPRTATTSLAEHGGAVTQASRRRVFCRRSLPAYMLELDGEQLDLTPFRAAVPRGARMQSPRSERDSCERRSGCGAVLHSPTRSSRTSRKMRSTDSRTSARRAGGPDLGRPRRRRRRGPGRPRWRHSSVATRCASDCASHLMLALYRSRPAGGRAQRRITTHAERSSTSSASSPGPELQALYGSILRQERSLVRVAPPALEDHYDEVMRAFLAGRLVPVLGPGAGGIAGGELATPARRAVRARGGGSRPRVHLTGRGGAERNRARSTTSSISRSTGTSSRRRYTRG